MMTIPELRDLARSLLQEAIADLRAKGSVSQKFILAKRGGGIDFVFCAPDVTNSEDTKRELGRRLKARVQSGEIEAVTMVSDTWQTFDLTPEKEAARRGLGLTIKEAADAGLCTVVEAIIVISETPLYSQMATQQYRRAGAHVELIGEPLVSNSQEGGKVLPSRFGAYWPEAARA